MKDFFGSTLQPIPLAACGTVTQQHLLGIQYQDFRAPPEIMSPERAINACMRAGLIYWLNAVLDVELGL